MEQESYLSQHAPASAKRLRTCKFDQSAAVCWRLGSENLIDVLLVTSRDTGRWVIPKGNIEKGEQLHHCAQREAREEAGVIGRVSKKAIGQFTYLKDPKRLPFVVSVFPLMVEKEPEKYRERGQRQRLWVPASRASTLVAEPELRNLFELIASNNRPKLFDKCIGTLVR